MEPPEARRRAEGTLRRLTALARAADPARSAAAHTARAWVQFEFFHDSAGASRSLGLALRRSPREQDAEDYLIHVAAVVGAYPRVAAACRRQMRRRPEVRLRVILADAACHLARWGEARTQMEAAHAAQPRDWAVSLGLAALLLKSGQAPDASRAGLLLDKIAPLLANRPPDQRAEYDATRGIGSALAGQTDDARRFLRLALKNDANNKAAKAALALLPG
jgi:hypothetical protein